VERLTLEKQSTTANETADFLRNYHGVNILPADVSNADNEKRRKPLGLELCNYTWSQWKENPIPLELHNKWKELGLFEKGIAIICGKVMHKGLMKRPLFFNGLDCDNLVASSEFWKDGMENKTMIEQHINTPSKSHIYYLTEDRPMKSRTSNEGNIESKGLDPKKVPIIEVQSGGDLMFCSPSPHRDGSNYAVVGTTDVLSVPVEELEKMVDGVLEKYGMNYLKESKTNVSAKIENLPNKKAESNRQGDLLTIVTTYAMLNKGLIDEDDVINYSKKQNQRLGEPYPESRAIEIGKYCHGCAMNDEPNPIAEIKTKLKTNWNIIKNPKLDDDVKTNAKQEINKLQEELGSDKTVWDEVPNELKKQLDVNWEIMKSKPTKKVRTDTMLKINELEKLAGKEITSWDDEEKGDDAKLYELALSRIEKMIISKNNSHEVYAVVKIEDHFESVNLGGSRSMYWLNHLLSSEIKSNKIHSSDFYRNILTAISSKAQMESISKEYVYNRISFTEDTIFYYLANNDYEVITISKNGIEKIKLDVKTPIFTQSQVTTNQIEPIYDDETALDELVQLLQIKDEQLFKVHLITMFLEHIPIPIMLFDGKAGSYKTTITASIKRIIDPSGDKKDDNVVSIPKKYDDIIMTLFHRYVTVLENVSKIDNETSDVFCRAITGSSNTKRELYSNLEEVILTFKRKLIINGVVPNLNNTDLQQRIISYDRNSSNVMGEKEYEIKFNELRPRVLGQIFQTLQKSMEIIDDIEFKPQTRMADFEKWGECISITLGYDNGSLGDEYQKKLKSSAISSKESHPIIAIIEAIVVDKDYENTMAELYNLVRNTAFGLGIDINNKFIHFPKIASQLSTELVVVSPVLEKLGYEIKIWNNSESNEFSKNARMIKIKKIVHNFKCTECNTSWKTSDSLSEVQKGHEHIVGEDG
jgi:hypothetical protein